MNNEIFRGVAYLGTDKRIIATGLECNAIASGHTVDQAFSWLEIQIIGRLRERQNIGLSPYSPAESRLWELVTPELNPVKITKHQINNGYNVELRFYDRTDVHIPIEELLNE